MTSISKTTRSHWSKFFYYFRIIFGFAFILLAFGILFDYGQWRGPSLFASQSKVISPDQVTKDPSLQGQLVSVTGPLTSRELVSDDLFLKGDYIALKRQVEMYAWAEFNGEESSDGSDIPNHVYEKNWYAYGVVGPDFDSKHFEHPEGHVNPTQPIRDTELSPKDLYVGAYSVGDIGDLDLPYAPVSFSEKNVNLKGRAVIGGGVNEDYRDFIFVPGATSTGTLSNPQVGDIRMAYFVLNTNATTTLMGKLEGNKISPYFFKKSTDCRLELSSDAGCKFYLILGDNTTRDSFIKEGYVNDHGWFAALAILPGFVFMFLGLLIVLTPLGIVPFTGWASVVGVFVGSFVLSFILASIIPSIPQSLHSYGLTQLVAATSLIAAVMIFWFKNRNCNK